MAQKKTLAERVKELQDLLGTPEGRRTLQELEARYRAVTGTARATKSSVVTYIIVHERGRGLISG